MTTATNALLLGPIVGHTDASSSRVWIQAAGAPEPWHLLIPGFEPFAFVSTETGAREFGTAIATATGLEPDTLYSYEVRCDGAEEAAEHGSFRTMPPEDARTQINFVTFSCDDDREPNAWQRLQQHIRDEQPRFLLMTGDQVYLDEEDDGNVWDLTFDSPRDMRRKAMVQKYEKLWAVEPQATIFRNIPCYMIWDDHDIRDGWGSFAGDSPTLAAQSEDAARIVAKYRAYFEDAYDVFYHFQACRNPMPAPALEGRATPFSFRCGRLFVVVPDGRSERDFARPSCAILGEAQWQWLDEVVAAIGPEVDAIAVATSVPIVDVNPDGAMHKFFSDRTDDIDLLAKGDEEGLLKLLTKGDSIAVAIPSLLAAATIDRDFKLARKLGFRSGDIDDVRDKWSYVTNRPEQERMIRLFAKATTLGRESNMRRALSFFGGDIHVGAVLKVTMTEDSFGFDCVVSSGIAKSAPIPEVRGVLVDTDFEAAPGIHVVLDNVENAVNFAATTVTFEPEFGGAIGSRIIRGDSEPETPKSDEAP